ncbi:hypothetical protein DUNSADRAFT_16817 [Dunaliella salina]|uniref:Encoded protein n=1 Tax=Dunaliella salina TaxID=3046 RepID=A0ABQ7G2T8_DUNSA|nr:hypothetical protein DUNSADRAFT_16817 [Dunaliella salina]|eukprot:KAF5828925.1 hypothetical protein DUNSADRAFT_16817 [Dunaliella salina]
MLHPCLGDFRSAHRSVACNVTPRSHRRGDRRPRLGSSVYTSVPAQQQQHQAQPVQFDATSSMEWELASLTTSPQRGLLKGFVSPRRERSTEIEVFGMGAGEL